MKTFSFKRAAAAAVLLFGVSSPVFAQIATVDAAAVASLGKQLGLSHVQIAQMAKDLQIATQGLMVMQDSYAAMQYLNSGMAIKNTFLSAGPAFIGARYGNQWGETAQWGLAMTTGGPKSYTAWINSAVQLSPHLNLATDPNYKNTLAQVELADAFGGHGLDASGACASWMTNAGSGILALLKLAQDSSKLMNSLGVQTSIANLLKASQMNSDKCHLQMQQALLQVQMTQTMRQRNEDVIVINRAADQAYIQSTEQVFNLSDPVQFANTVFP
ncbi:MAG TPA: hypothetical protein VH351_15540 [Bryobacteraceae bacterium]|jgi:hypothetical protein|nr:hypothetical protein [Bryobacteraceae bacterium]